MVKAFDQKQVMFGVLKVLGRDVRKSVESIRPKFIFFTFIGNEVPVLQRARVSVQRPDIEKLFNVSEGKACSVRRTSSSVTTKNSNADCYLFYLSRSLHLLSFVCRVTLCAWMSAVT